MWEFWATQLFFVASPLADGQEKRGLLESPAWPINSHAAQGFEVPAQRMDPAPQLGCSWFMWPAGDRKISAGRTLL